ncbi:MAG: FAD-dependent oxidoreductase [Blautia sp.]|nr:FAD-dependent oxidoreductase [Blautia sp.]MCM1200483.1 FAD-binding protein [Bacteroides fragilis]
MIRISQMKMPVSHREEALPEKAAELLHIEKGDILSWRIVKKSTDARKKPDIYFIYTLDVEIRAEEKFLRRLERNARTGWGKHGVQVQKTEETAYRFPKTAASADAARPVIVGTGPAGLFCGYLLAQNGYRPILLERGKAVEDRKKDVELFWKTGVLKPDSNVQFGEGGAGAFSDGKLNTLVKDKNSRNKEVLRIFVQAGAPEEILYEAKPHIGTDLLLHIVRNMREKILAWGGEVRFESRVTDIVTDSGVIRGVIINDTEWLEADTVVLAVGHSARDTFEMLCERAVPMEAKPFAVGLRIEHPRRMINRLQYGAEESRFLQAADYKLTAKTKSGRGVYSFCMCPGGYVVNASSEEGRLAVNGMSYSGRDGRNSNSAVIVTVTPEDFGSGHPLAGIEFQRSLEEKAYRIGRGRIPVERYGDFRKAVTGKEPEPSEILREYPDFMPEQKGGFYSGGPHGETEFSPVSGILPHALNLAFVEGMEQFDRKLPGFQDSGVYVSGVESRTSSPVRIPRDESGQSALKGLYPCGEGAGYAGGITSAAMDGIYIAERIAVQNGKECL